MKILAIDGNSILNRAFYGIRLLSNSKGFFTNAITGFMNIYLKEIDIVKPDCVIVAFDLKAPTFRHKKVSSYKANRKGMPPELHQQLPIIKELLTHLGISILEKEGYEADDILGTIAQICEDTNNDCYILTGDRDSLQLINNNVTIRLATNKETIIFNEEKFKEVYGIEPIELIELKALMGDSSDNIKGVAGIGEKTATTLIKEHHNIEQLFKNLPNANLTQSVRTKLEAGYEDAVSSKWLATIVKDVPIEKNIESYKLKEIDMTKSSELLAELEMFKLMDKLGINKEHQSSFEELEAEDKIVLEKMQVSELDENSLKTITNNKSADYILIDNVLQIVQNNNIYTTSNEKLILSFLSSDIKKRTFEAKASYKLSFNNGVKLKAITFCCDLAGYLLNSMASDYSIKNLCDTYKVRYRKDMSEYSDIASLSSLCDRLKNEIEISSMESLLYEIEQPLCEVLASMETIGIKVDTDGVKDFGLTLSQSINSIQSQIYNLAGKEFNISSPKQLGVVLFEDLGLPVKKKTKTGYSTNAEVLEKLSGTHPIIELIIEYRTLTKLSSTYVDGLLKEVYDDGRVHSVFKQTETRTGRISSTEPNLQNIPVRKEIGRNMRRFFVAKDGYTLLDADYSQIELRVLADVCNDENMQKAFLDNVDIHTITASQVFGVPQDMVLPEMRSAAKAVNFGIIYGISAFSLSQDIGVSVADAKKYINNYLNNYPNVQKFMDETVENGIQNGYVTTIFGRRRYIPELNSSNKILQAFGKRAAMNAPIQGAAADIIKIAMVKVYQKLREENLDARLILQVHDELIVEASKKDKDLAAKILHEQMQNAVDLAVPMTADVNEGRSWYDAKG